MHGKFIRDSLMASTIIAGAVVFAAPAFAQAAPATPIAPATAAPDNSAPADIIVTGSRIPQPNLTSASPVTVLGSQAAKLQGVTRIEDLINSLPQAFAAQSSGVSNGSDGTASVNLRGLGQQRTLVLIDGKRLGAGDPVNTSPAADLNFIPTSLIKRVDVLTGGASSVYGSDAVAGVVNFIMDTDFTGIGADTEYGIYQHDNDDRSIQALENRFQPNSAPSGNTVDGRTFDTTVKMGAGFDDNRGHIVGYFGYRKISAIAQSARDYSQGGLTSTPDGFTCCSGSSTADPATLTLGVGPTGTPNQQYAVVPGGGLRPGTSGFNANPFNYFQRPDERYTAGFFGHYNVSDGFKPYLNFMFMHDHTDAVIAPSGDFGNTSTINCDNPYLSGSPFGTQPGPQYAAICNPANLTGNTVFNPVTGAQSNTANLVIARRNVEGGGRDADLTHIDYRAVIGAKGDIAKGISYDASFQYYTDVFSEIYKNEFSVSRLNNALDTITGANGAPTCRVTAAGGDPNCVPLDLFSGAPISAAAENYLEVPGFQSGYTRETVAGGSITVDGGEYGLQSPWADHGIGLNVGVEYRKESIKLDVDNEFATGDLAGQGGPTLPIQGSLNVKEIYGEISVPLVSDKPFFHALTLDGGFRYSDYSTSGGVQSYKGQLTWAPVRDITFRGGYNRAVRAANVQELFLAQSVQIDGSTDPCAGATPTFTQAQCVNLGVPTSAYGNVPKNAANQYNGQVGGNPNLKPEKADTFTAGVVLQPSFLPGFSATVDAYSIKVKGLIGNVGADIILNQCGVTGSATYCDLIHRDQNNSLYLSPNGYVVDTNLNLGTLKTRGIDVGVSYTKRTDKWGTFGFNMNGTYLDQFKVSIAGAVFDCAGLYGGTCSANAAGGVLGVPAPKWRHQARLSWTSPDGFGLSLNWRYFGKATQDTASSQPYFVAQGGDAFPVDDHIKAQSYFDLVATGHVADHFELRLGVNNIADKKPPLLGSEAAPVGTGNGNTYPQFYDALGRYLFVGLSVSY
jgi:outer membrane receptor protein involved in Fe transport